MENTRNIFIKCIIDANMRKTIKIFNGTVPENEVSNAQTSSHIGP
jgi:hypothetical protein